jgi:mycothiol synthase
MSGKAFEFGNVVAQLSELSSKTTRLGESSDNRSKTIGLLGMSYSVGMDVRCILPHEHESAAALLFAGLPEEERTQRIGMLMQLVADGVCTPAGWSVAVDGDTILGTLLTQLLPTGTAIYTLPKGDPTSFTPLIQFGLQQLREQNFQQASMFLDATDDDAESIAVLEQNGFRYITQLQSLQRLVEEVEEPASLRLEPFHEGDEQFFGEVILATYADSLDAPEAHIERNALDTVAAYRQGNPTLPNWWIARDSDGESVGVVLLAPVVGFGVELAYLGLVPKMRGFGLGETLLDVAFWQAWKSGAKVLTVTVDERNTPAMKIYQRNGFTLYQSQRLYLWKPTGST